MRVVRGFWLVGVVMALTVAGCSTQRSAVVSRLSIIPSLNLSLNLPTVWQTPREDPSPGTIEPPPVVHTQTGMASWYGPRFHGRRTANGEVYNQHALTAAHRTLPMGARAVVTNLSTGQSVEVRINDRGPYKDGRVIDLSYAAARSIGIRASGVASVRIEVLSLDGFLPTEALFDPPVASAYAVLVGSFTDAAEANTLMRDLSQYHPDTYVTSLSSGLLRYYQVRLGPFLSRSEAARRAKEVTQTGILALIVTEDDRRAERE